MISGPEVSYCSLKRPVKMVNFGGGHKIYFFPILVGAKDNGASLCVKNLVPAGLYNCGSTDPVSLSD